MNGNQQHIVELRRLFEPACAELRTQAHRCEHDGCKTIVLSARFCWQHRHLTSADRAAGR